MQFQKTITLTNAVQKKLYEKELNFQRGQLVQLEDGTTKGRFISRSPQMIHIVWSGNTRSQGFQHNCKQIKARKLAKKAGRRTS